AAGWAALLAGGVVGAAAGLYAARTVAMTAMPQLVSLFNAVGGGAAALLAAGEITQSSHVPARSAITGALDILIGAITFSGSLIAAGKLQGIVSGAPVVFRGSRALNVLLAGAFAGGAGWLIADPGSTAALALLAAASLAFGVTMVL